MFEIILGRYIFCCLKTPSVSDMQIMFGRLMWVRTNKFTKYNEMKKLISLWDHKSILFLKMKKKNTSWIENMIIQYIYKPCYDIGLFVFSIVIQQQKGINVLKLLIVPTLFIVVVSLMVMY